MFINSMPLWQRTRRAVGGLPATALELGGGLGEK
jgi:hypothetical protein